MKLALVRGDTDGVRRHLPRVELVGTSTIWRKSVQAVRARGLAAVGDIVVANEALTVFLAAGPELHSHYLVNPFNTDLILATLDLGVGDRETLADAVLDEQWHWNVNGSVDRWRGKAYLLRGDLDAAERWLEVGAASCRERGIELELGRCIQDLASLAEARGQHETALERLEQAGEIYSRLGAGGYLNEVIAKKEILKA